jgi:hypothetical protein
MAEELKRAWAAGPPDPGPRSLPVPFAPFRVGFPLHLAADVASGKFFFGGSYQPRVLGYETENILNFSNEFLKYHRTVRSAYQPLTNSTFLSEQISQQYFSLRTNQPTVLFSQNKPAPAISHQPNKQPAFPFKLFRQKVFA